MLRKENRCQRRGRTKSAMPAIENKPDLPQRLDALLAEGCSPEDFLSAVSARSAATADAAWENLALIDQLYRRGKLSATLFHAAKARIERRALGFQEPVGFPERRAVNDSSACAQGKPAVALSPERKSGSPTTSPAPAPAPAPAPTPMPVAEDRSPAKVYMPDSAPAVEHRRINRMFQHYCAATSQAQRVLLVVTLGVVAVLPALIRSSSPPPALPAPVPAPRMALAGAPAPALPGQLSLTANRYIVRPVQHQAVLSIKRLGGTSGAVGVDYWAVGLGAKSGRDYALRGQQTLTLADGHDSAQIEISILPNRQRRHTEMFEVRIGRQSGGATLGELTRATVFILPQ